MQGGGRESHMNFTHLSELLAATVARAPQGRAIADERDDLDWRAFAARVEGYAGLLAGRGVKAGDRIALWLPNSADYLALVFALARLAATAVHVNTRFRATEVGYLLARSQASALVTDFDFAPVDFARIFGDIPASDRAGLRLLVSRGDEGGEIAGLPVAALRAEGAAADVAHADAPCLTFTTSGTTSGPKLVLHTQRSIAWHASDVARALELDRSGARVLAVAPLCGTFGLALALAAVAAGAPLFTLAQFDGARAEALIRARRITHTAGGDDMLARVCDAAGGKPFDSLVWTGYASFTPNAAAHIARADALGMRPRGLYGMSEVQALFAHAPDARRMVDGGAAASPLARIAIRDPETGADLPEGADGELCLKAPSLFAGYLGNEEATRKAFWPDGMFRTGDLAALVAPGFIYRMRLGDGLRLGGFLVAPEEIEGFLQTQPGVAGAQVVAAEREGARVVFAFVTAKPEEWPDERQIIAACKTSLARYKVPVRVVTLDAFPVTESPNGVKIQRAKLRDMAEAMLKSDA
jgi:fatty-acyl-CoA synthase